MIFLLKHKAKFLAFTATLILISVLLTVFFKIPIGIDLTGGTAVEVSFTEEVNTETINQIYEDNNIESASIRPVGDNRFLIRSKSLDENQQESILNGLKENSGQILRLSTIGPSIGSELRNKSIVAFIVVAIAIMLYIAYVFRKVSKPLSSWYYSFITIITLLHDVIIPAGVFALVSYFTGYELDTLFITAILVVMGYSINDTIVVMDRVRENLIDKDENQLKNKENFYKIVSESLGQTITRSINTSFTTILSLLALIIFGGEVLRPFVLVMLVGVIAGTYSSIFVAVPVLTAFYDRKMSSKDSKNSKK